MAHLSNWKGRKIGEGDKVEKTAPYLVENNILASITLKPDNGNRYHTVYLTGHDILKLRAILKEVRGID